MELMFHITQLIIFTTCLRGDDIILIKIIEVFEIA
jgi:hypothetical protein